MRQNWLIIGALIALLSIAALLGRLSAPDERLTDPRASTLLTGPAGLSGLAEALGALGLPVARRRSSFISVDAGRQRPSPQTLLVFMDLSFPPGDAELAGVMRLREQGQHLLVAGSSSLERCFGFRVEYEEVDSLAIARGRDLELPGVSWVLSPLREFPEVASLDRRCRPQFPTRVDTLLAAMDGRLVAARLSFRRGGSVTLVSDVELFANRALRNTDAGELVIPWFFGPGVTGAVFDEYHHGFGSGGSIWSASMAWLVRSPGGWLILQLVAAGLVALALAAVRFGPALTPVEARRRSPLEHVEALATGLQGARAHGIAIERFVDGLRRRLLVARGGRPPRGTSLPWLQSMLAAPGSSRAKPALQRLVNSVQKDDRDGVQDAALAVEDVWEAMGTSGKPRKS